MQVSAFPAIFKANFGHFQHVLAVFRHVSAGGRYDLIWPIRSILAESARFGANRSRFGTNRAESARIREKKKKKKKTQTRVRHLWCRVRAF